MKLITFDKRIVNVAMLFLAAYTIVHLLYLTFVYFCAKAIGIEDVDYYFSFIFYDITEYKDWTRTKILILFGMPGILMLVMAGLFWVAMKGFSYKDEARRKLFFLWLILISLSFFLGEMISAPFYRHGFSVVAEWFYFSKEVVFGLALFFIALIPLIAYFSSISFMKLANSRSYLRTKWTRLIFLLNTILLPIIIGTLIISIMIINAPGYNLDFFLSIDFVRFIVLFFILLFVLFFNFNKGYVAITRTRDLEYISFSMITVVVIIISVIYLGLYFT
jgi:hypothetical protein